MVLDFLGYHGYYSGPDRAEKNLPGFQILRSFFPDFWQGSMYHELVNI